MAYITYIEKFKKGNDEYNIKAASAETAIVADRAITADTVDNAERIGNVKKYSTTPSGDDDKYREGLRIENTHGKDGLVQGIIELNNKGNLAVESLDNHVNLEAKKQIKMKPTTKMIWDSSRKVAAGKGNEFEIEAVNDDLDTNNQEKWSELKIKSRNIDLRCNNHGGIALQIAGKDGDGNENKIKFESDRTSSISEAGTYNGEGGKGLEFGTFNNLHSSLYTGDYRFNGNGMVYGASREAPVQTETGKWDYPTQSDDFKDIITETTKRATWNQIIDAANKCKDKETIASEAYVLGEIARAQLPESEVDTSQFATTGYVQEYVAEHGGSGGGNLTAGSGIHIEDNTISVNNYSNIEPLTALTENLEALKYIEIGDKKGNFQIDNKDAYTYQATIDTTDENFNPVSKDARIQVSNITDEGYYTDERKYYYSPTINTFDHNHNEINAKVPVLKYIETVVNNEHIYTKNISDEDETTFYQNESKIYYKANKKNAAMKDNSKVAKNWIVITDSDIAALNSESATTVSQEDIDSYYSTSPDWDLAYIWKKGMKDEEGNKYWPSGKIWEVNEININLETGSKIKFAGEKIEVLNSKDDGFGNDIAMKSTKVMSDEIEVFTSALTFSRSITKNGVESGYDPIISFEYKNNVADTDKVPDLETFIINYKSKHEGTTLSDAEIEEIYNRLSNEVGYEPVSVKLSDLLKLVNKVAELETRIAALENQ